MANRTNKLGSIKRKVAAYKKGANIIATNALDGQYLDRIDHMADLVKIAQHEAIITSWRTVEEKILSMGPMLDAETIKTLHAVRSKMSYHRKVIRKVRAAMIDMDPVWDGTRTIADTTRNVLDEIGDILARLTLASNG
nr:hypothetical protein [Candidatus Sigynarchaeota archaeon]